MNIINATNSYTVLSNIIIINSESIFFIIITYPSLYTQLSCSGIAITSANVKFNV